MRISNTMIARYKHVIAFGLAAIILAAIFVPYQLASAFTLSTSLPNSTGNTITQTVAGNDFQTTITVANGELISISGITVLLDDNLGDVKITNFEGSGAFTSGDLSLIKDNVLSVSASTSSTSGYYGYGYGQIFTSLGYTPPYQYAFSGYTQNYLAGNTGGYANYVTGANVVNGYIGPATITISGKLNTALMSATSHTLDVIVDTGAGGNGVDKLIAPQISFTVNPNSGIVSTSVSSGGPVTLPPITVPGVTTPISVSMSFVQDGGQFVIQKQLASILKSLISDMFEATGDGTSIFQVGTSNGNTVGPILDIDASTIALGPGGTFDVTIPYDPTLLPSGFNEANVKFFHWNGSTWEDKTLSVDTSANTVTGRLTSLSPVVAGYISTSPSPGNSGGGGGGGGGGSSGGIGGGNSIDLTTTYSDTYFIDHPLAKVQLQNSGFVNANGLAVYAARSGQQIDITSTFKNYQGSPQTYAMIVQIVDKDGFTAEVGWLTGTLASGETADASKSWTTGDAGSYTVKIFVWDGISGAPTPLSEVTTRNFVVG